MGLADTLEVYWRLTPDERVAWDQTGKPLNAEVAAEVVVTLASASRTTPSIPLFMATYNGIVRRRQRHESVAYKPRSDWFAEQREVLRQARLRREQSHRGL